MIDKTRENQYPNTTQWSNFILDSSIIDTKEPSFYNKVREIRFISISLS